MPIETINGVDFYNYELKDAKILEEDSRLQGSKANSFAFRESSVTRHRKKAGRCARCCKFLYNKENKTSCNRTGKLWGALIFYYAFFLGFIFVVFFCYFYGINRTMQSYASPDFLAPAEPKFYESPVPTFTYVPLSVNEYSHPMIWYKMEGVSKPTNRRASSYVAAIKQFYKTQATVCTKQRKSACPVDPQFYGPCGEASFGYEKQKPCLLLKLNTRRGWRPDAYHSLYRIPDSMPSELKKHIGLNRETLCIHCNGVTGYDEQKIGEISYYPERCYNDSVFPFADSPIDVNPTIAIQLTQITPGFLVELSCRLFGMYAFGTGEHQQTVFLYIGNK